MAKKSTPDKWLFAATVGLALFGVVMVYSASAVLAQNENHGQFFYVVKQGIWTLIGFVVMFAAMQFDYKHLKNRRVVYGLEIDKRHVMREKSIDGSGPTIDHQHGPALMTREV